MTIPVHRVPADVWERITGRKDVLAAAPIPPPPAGTPPLPPITFATEAMSLGRALVRWHRAGYKLATREQRGQRKAACAVCVLPDGQAGFDATARAGLGKCRACGCTCLKWWLKTERCPLSRWIA